MPADPCGDPIRTTAPATMRSDADPGGTIVRVRAIAAVAAGLLVIAGCSSDAKSSDSTTTKGADSSSSTTAAAPAKLRVLVTNDDGFAAPGIDTMVQALRADPDIEVTVVAPLKNQSGAGGKTTPGTLVATDQKTTSGYAAVAVDGYPADSVAYALAKVLDRKPDLVVSGINFGQNLGGAVHLSGTVGAAMAAVNADIPSIAVSAGIAEQPNYAGAAKYAMQWITANTSRLLAKKAPVQVVNLNVPTCDAGDVRGVKQVPASTNDSEQLVAKVDCNQTTTDVSTDIAAFNAGFAAVTNLTGTGETVTSTTSFPGG